MVTASGGDATSAPTATTRPAPEATETPVSVPTETAVPSAATTPLPANTPAPEAASEPTQAPAAPTQAPAAPTPVPTLASETPTRGHKLASTPTKTVPIPAVTPAIPRATPTGATAEPTASPIQAPSTANPDKMPGKFPVEPPVRGNDSDQVQVGSPGLRKDLFGVPLVFSPDVRSEFGSATETASRYGSIQSVEIALPHPDGRHGPVHGTSESKYGCVARGQLAVVFNLEVQDRQVLLPGPCLWSERPSAESLGETPNRSSGPAVTYTETRVSADPGPAQPLVQDLGGRPPAAREDVHLLHELVLERTPL